MNGYIERLIPGLRRAKYKDFELKFGEKLQQLEAKAETAQLPQPPEPKRLLGDKPRQPAVCVELALAEAGGNRAQLEFKPSRPSEILRRLESSGVVSKDTAPLIRELHNLRNEAIHTAIEIPPDLAYEYVRLAERVMASIHAASRR